MVKRLQEQISILDLAFGAKNLIFARNAVNTPPPSLTDLIFLGRGVFTANTTVTIQLTSPAPPKLLVFISIRVYSSTGISRETPQGGGGFIFASLRLYQEKFPTQEIDFDQF